MSFADIGNALGIPENTAKTKIFCGDCWKRLYFHRQRIDYRKCKVNKEIWQGSYLCSTSFRRLGCTRHSIRQNVLNEKVLNAVRVQVKVGLDYDILLEKLRVGNGEKCVREGYNSGIAALKLKLNSIEQKRKGLYEDYSQGILSGDEYMFAKSAFENDYENLSKSLDVLMLKKNEFENAISSENKWIKLMKSISRAKN